MNVTSSSRAASSFHSSLSPPCPPRPLPEIHHPLPLPLQNNMLLVFMLYMMKLLLISAFNLPAARKLAKKLQHISAYPFTSCLSCTSLVIGEFNLKTMKLLVVQLLGLLTHMPRSMLSSKQAWSTMVCGHQWKMNVMPLTKVMPLSQRLGVKMKQPPGLLSKYMRCVMCI